MTGSVELVELIGEVVREGAVRSVNKGEAERE